MSGWWLLLWNHTATKGQEMTTTTTATTTATRPGHWNPFVGAYTRHNEPNIRSAYSTGALLGLTAEQSRRQIAVHESAHFVLFRHFGITPEYITITESEFLDDGRFQGWVSSGHVRTPAFRMNREEYFQCLAAGERAEDRLMREEGYWTRTRAWAVELNNTATGSSDRRVAEAVLKDCTGADMVYDLDGSDPDHNWYSIQDRTDWTLDRNWDCIMNLAAAVVEHDFLPGNEALVAMYQG